MTCSIESPLLLLLKSDKTEVVRPGTKHPRNMFSTHAALLSAIKVPQYHWICLHRPTFQPQEPPSINFANFRIVLSQSDEEGNLFPNSLLSGCPNKLLQPLQLVQNAAAWMSTWTRNRDHIGPVQASLHLLPVIFRVGFKIFLLT